MCKCIRIYVYIYIYIYIYVYKQYKIHIFYCYDLINDIICKKPTSAPTTMLTSVFQSSSTPSTKQAMSDEKLFDIFKPPNKKRRLELSNTSDRKILYVSFDLETTGLCKRWSNIIQIGCCGLLWHAEGDRIEIPAPMKFESYISSVKKVSPRITRITGITSSDIQNAPDFYNTMESWAKHIKQWRELCGVDSVVLIGHNILKYDLPLLINNLIRHQMNVEYFFRCNLKVQSAVDTLYLAKTLSWRTYWVLPKTPTGRISYNLGGMYESICKRKLENAHSALADAQGVAQVMACVHKRVPSWKKPKYGKDMCLVIQAVVQRNRNSLKLT